jgi:hypothetical protein
MCGIAGWVSYDGDLKSHQDVIASVQSRVNKDGFRELLVLAKNPESAADGVLFGSEPKAIMA